MKAATAASFSTYVSTNTALPPLASISAATRWPRSTSRSAKATCAPSAMKRRTVASPIPDAPPVTAATLPLSCPIDPILRCVVPDLVRTLALLARRWSAIILASIGKSNSLFHRPRPLTPRVEQREQGDAGGYAAIGISSTSTSMSGYQRLQIVPSSPLSVRTRVCNNTCAPFLDHGICCCLQHRLLTTSFPVDSTHPVAIASPW